MNVTAYKVVRKIVEETVDEADLISINEASKTSGLTISGVSRLLDRGRLPEYRLLPRMDDDVQRFTSRKAISELSKPKKRIRTTKK